MPKRWCDGDEWYPVFCLEDEECWTGEESAEFTEEEIADIYRVFEEFDRVQKLIAKRFRYDTIHSGIRVK